MQLCTKQGISTIHKSQQQTPQKLQVSQGQHNWQSGNPKKA